MTDLLSQNDARLLQEYWRKNALLSCTIASVAKTDPVTGDTAEKKACMELLRKLGGDRGSVKPIGSFYRHDDGSSFEVFVGSVGQYGECHLIASKKFGTCWYVAFSSVTDGMLRHMFPGGRADLV